MSCSRLWRLRGLPQRPPRARLSILAWAWAAAGSEPGKCSWGRPCLASPATHAALKFENHRIILLHIFWSIRSEQLKVQSRPGSVETLINSSHFTVHRAGHRMTLQNIAIKIEHQYFLLTLPLRMTTCQENDIACSTKHTFYTWKVTLSVPNT